MKLSTPALFALGIVFVAGGVAVMAAQIGGVFLFVGPEPFGKVRFLELLGLSFSHSEPRVLVFAGAICIMAAILNFALAKKQPKE